MEMRGLKPAHDWQQERCHVTTIALNRRAARSANCASAS
jgi:hypothetical protein